MKASMTTKALQYTRGIFSLLEDETVSEHQLDVYLNGDWVKTLLCTPLALAELVIGSLVCDRLIRSQEAQVTLSENQKSALVTIRESPADELLPLSGHLPVIKPDHILGLIHKFVKTSSLFTNTGGVHSAAIATGTEIIAFFDDIGRLNAIDKVIGHCFLHNISLKDKILLTSGRVSTEVLVKPLSVGIPCIVSKAAVTAQAIELGRTKGITIVGFARDERFNVYSGDSLQ